MYIKYICVIREICGKIVFLPKKLPQILQNKAGGKTNNLLHLQNLRENIVQKLFIQIALKKSLLRIECDLIKAEFL